ncbi:LA_2478/LA_2722/LA_4182 family protein [Leptospira interrogans]|uniref:Uncharacterized protein n=2 Tax=Leptospira interrogans TaxID=173 RepID=A0A0F6H511_LEPIR|nr:hypothetical protein [Leptospira interrogans]EKO23299.1 hypothetical protein LEP1GSC104_0060 [Leptospira interrogans str. UI 12621]EMF72373.1 hypothetical protein LEP1GSC148_2797 [Leptospira interrogans serovar Canicola str. LT1962]EMM82667.1 hypothetical protein LEP1GSC037_1968 [Leptospira interrogans str. 2006001854]EMM90840.1 hypothetical protein LEP1GSC145_1735 [Leptospira interrogans serovar Djasiman str. LT1649]
MKLNKLFLIFGIFFLFNVLGCKKKSPPQGIQDEVWREESSGLISAYCQKISTCAEVSLKSLKESSKTLIQERLNPANCAEKFRKSNAYLLTNENPETIKKAVRGCFQTVIKESCDKIQKGVLELSEDCSLLQTIQSK